MRNTVLAALAGLALTACPSTPPGPTPTGGGSTSTGGGSAGGAAQVTRVDVTEAITAATTWTKDKEYVLKSIIHVDNAVLTIQPGTKVLGERGSALIVTRTGQLLAEGTATYPVTSRRARGL